MARTEPLIDLPVAAFQERLASGDPTPGGGSAAALAGAMGAALLSMVCNLTLGKEEFADVAEQVERLLDDSEAARAALEFGVEADSEAFGLVAAAYRLPRGTEEEKKKRRAAIRAGSVKAAEVPLEAARVCSAALLTCARVAELGNPRVLSDVAVAAQLLRAALYSSLANVEVNLDALKQDPFVAEARIEVARLRQGRDAEVELILTRIKHRG
jgi:formiminotetrahydrofolate cyclodeaminase